MSLLFFTPSRTVLLLSDDALYIYVSNARGVRLMAFVLWDTESFEQDVAKIIAKDCKRNPVLILNDMVEQHYRKERVVRKGVGVLDRASMLQRKLKFAFPNYPIRASFPLKEKIKGKGEGSAADVYIFAAIPNSPQFEKTMDAVVLSLASMVSVCLLPVESSDMIKDLSAKLEAKKRKKSKWTVFMGQHQSGGLRQIVIKDGEIALTRITPLSSSEDDHKAWASEAFQEFTSTMSYVSRFGFQPEDGLSVIAIANPGAGQAFNALVEETYECEVLSPREAAKTLGISIGSQEQSSFADPLHVSWIARKSKFILPMQARRIHQVSRPRKIAMAAMLFMVLGMCFLGYQIFNQLISLSEVRGDISTKKSQQAQLQLQYEKEVARKEALGFDVRLVQSSIAVHSKLEADNIKTLALLKGIGRALGRDLRVDKIKLERLSGGLLTNLPGINAFGQSSDQKLPPNFQITMQLTYPGTTDIERGNKEVADFGKRLSTFFPDYEVEVTKFLKDYEYVEEITVEAGEIKNKNVKQDFIVELVIKGATQQ